jgi:Fe(3+) dicitrate transport protein
MSKARLKFVYGLKRVLVVFAALILYSAEANAGVGVIRGTIRSARDHEAVGNVRLELSPLAPQSVGNVRQNPPGLERRDASDAQGAFEFDDLPPGTYLLRLTKSGYRAKLDTVTLMKEVAFVSLDLSLDPISYRGSEAVVTGKTQDGSIAYLPSVQGTAIYEGKKNELILVEQLDANLAANNPRQIFSRVPGANIVENDGGGIQLGLAVRGLNPNRLTEFNSRQNGYDISADALGYPESYYTPPSEGVERVEVVRGAASLQYGSQFGGLLNFIMREQPKDKAIEVESHQTLASFGFFNSYNSIGGTSGNLGYYGSYHLKRGSGYRANAGFDVQTVYAHISYDPLEELHIRAEVTKMDYQMQQPGGQTDKQFQDDPRQATKHRNWFSADWLLPALHVDYTFAPTLKANLRSFGLIASRSSVGNLTPPSQGDTKINRTLMVDDYLNVGSELRLLHTYSIGSELATFLTGVRYYRGNTHRRQGFGSPDSSATFEFINPDDLEGSDFHFPSTNVAVFAENIFNLTPSLSLTPGFRWESIMTRANGYYRAGFERLDEERQDSRGFPLFGLGVMYRPRQGGELYCNISQAYSPVNFNDIRVANPNFKVDPNLKDVTGFNAELGYRSRLWNRLSFDLSAFYLDYNDRIGVLNQADSDFNIYRYRTNISDSRSLGLEVYTELAIVTPFTSEKTATSLFLSGGFIDARYTNSDFKGISGKKVEYAPEIVVRSGFSHRQDGFSGMLQMSYVSEQFTDATNTRITSTGINGLIPAYFVADLSLSYEVGILSVGMGVNNLFNRVYFTRRADGYPGPGILPADGRSFYTTVGLKI